MITCFLSYVKFREKNGGTKGTQQGKDNLFHKWLGKLNIYMHKNKIRH
jgi:hypothetical protein